ncbi:hypothetical protein [Streptomyces sp. NBC_01546]|uniref:hypothetical protein n=1 Tax=Streptomyces sp. NBC_01546 TaxID=2975872 RepID=UPI0038653F3B
MRDDHTAPGGASEEEALRGLLRGAVGGLEPSDGALERLRYAVPARRTLKRQAFIGAAAVALLAGTAIPAAMHMTAGEGASTEHSAMAGHGAEAGEKPGAAPADPHQNGSGTQPRATRSGSGAPDAGGTTGQPDPTASGSPAGGVTVGPTSSGTAPARSWAAATARSRLRPRRVCPGAAPNSWGWWARPAPRRPTARSTAVSRSPTSRRRAAPSPARTP